MATLNGSSLSGLEKAALAEAGAARRLAEGLRDLGGVLACLDTARLEEALGRARSCTDALSVAASNRAALTRLAARALGLPAGASLADVQAGLEGEGSEGFAEAARALADGLEEAFREASAHALAARYGAGLWAHRVGLTGGAAIGASYGPGGRFQPRAANVGRHV
jgi:hypothetical protein